MKKPGRPWSVRHLHVNSARMITPLPEKTETCAIRLAKKDEAGATPASPPRLPIDTELIPGRGGPANRPGQCAEADRERATSISPSPGSKSVAATADLTAARALWLPSLFLRAKRGIGPTARSRLSPGGVQTINRSALFLGGTAALNNTIQGPPARDRHSLRERLDGDAAGSPTRSLLPWRRGVCSTPIRRGFGPRPTTLSCRSPKGLFRPPGRDRAAGDRPRGHRERRGPLGESPTLMPSSEWASRPTIAGHLTEVKHRRRDDQSRQRSGARRFRQPDPSARARPQGRPGPD